MSKFRFFYTIFGALVGLACIPLILIDPVNSTVYLFIGGVSGALMFYFWAIEKRKMNQVVMIYVNDCDPLRYLEEYENLIRTYVSTSTSRVINQIGKALLLMEAGEIDSAKSILDALVDDEPGFNNSLKFLYYKAWIFYFDETNNLEKMEVLYNQAQKLLSSIPLKLKPIIDSNFKYIQARYFVKAGIYLDSAESIYGEAFKGRYPYLTVLNSIYYLGVIALKQGKKEIAMERFSAIIKSGKSNLAIFNKSHEMIKKIGDEQTPN